MRRRRLARMSSAADAADDSAAAPPRRRMRWWWLLLLVPVGVAGFLALRRRAADNELLREHRERSVAERAEIAARPRGHAPLQEPATAGEATALVERFFKALFSIAVDAQGCARGAPLALDLARGDDRNRT